MNLTISGHHLEVTPALRSYVTTKLDRITRHFDQLVDVKVLLTVEKQKEKENKEQKESVTGYIAQCNGNVPVSNRQEQEQEQEQDIYMALSAPETDEKPKQKKFVRPTVAEVGDYIREKGFGFSAERFVAYYDSNGWKVGKGAMKDWKAACRTWQLNHADSAPSSTTALFAGDI